MKNLSHFFRFCIMASHFKVCGNGTAKLIIRDNKAIQRIISQIMTYIPNGNAYFHGTHITLGVYRGKNYKEFENVLNDLYDFKIPIKLLYISTCFVLGNGLSKIEVKISIWDMFLKFFM